MTQPDRYTCEEAFARLEDYLDRELSAEEMRMVREHLETCAVCAREFGYEESVLRTIRGKLDHIDLPPDFLIRIGFRLREEKA